MYMYVHVLRFTVHTYEHVTLHNLGKKLVHVHVQCSSFIVHQNSIDTRASLMHKLRILYIKIEQAKRSNYMSVGVHRDASETTAVTSMN